jgi:hypothetical protein
MVQNYKVERNIKSLIFYTAFPARSSIYMKSKASATILSRFFSFIMLGRQYLEFKVLISTSGFRFKILNVYILGIMES